MYAAAARLRNSISLYAISFRRRSNGEETFFRDVIADEWK
jgi:hypothetical protein